MAENPNYEKLKQKLKKLEKEAVKGKQAQKVIERKITELDSFINNIPDMAWIKDENSRFVAVNRAFGDITRYAYCSYSFSRMVKDG